MRNKPPNTLNTPNIKHKDTKSTKSLKEISLLDIQNSTSEIQYSRYPVPATTSGETPLLRKNPPFRVFSVFCGFKKSVVKNI